MLNLEECILGGFLIRQHNTAKVWHETHANGRGNRLAEDGHVVITEAGEVD